MRKIPFAGIELTSKRVRGYMFNDIYTRSRKPDEKIVGNCCYQSIEYSILSIQNSMFICMVTHIARVWINRVRLPILLVVN